MNQVLYSKKDIVADLDKSIQIMKYDTLARKTKVAIADKCRNTENGITDIIQTAENLGWIWGGFHWYHV